MYRSPGIMGAVTLNMFKVPVTRCHLLLYPVTICGHDKTDLFTVQLPFMSETTYTDVRWSRKVQLLGCKGGRCKFLKYLLLSVDFASHRTQKNLFPVLRSRLATLHHEQETLGFNYPVFSCTRSHFLTDSFLLLPVAVHCYGQLLNTNRLMKTLGLLRPRAFNPPWGTMGKSNNSTVGAI